MNVLLDTHAFIWLDSVPRKLSSPAISICQDLSNQLFVSLVTIWEMQIKLQSGKLTLPTSIEAIVERQWKENRVTLLPIEFSHILRIRDLPELHRDPFDRMLVAQASVEKLVILSADEHVTRYPVQVVW